MKDIAKQVIDELRLKELHISTAESCTGGMVAAAIVDVSGASDVFEEGYITYSDRVKHKVLGVDTDLLEKYTAVSSEAAIKMAEGAAHVSGVDIAVSVTGYAGPYDGDDGTKAGTVYIGTFYKGTSRADKFLFKGGRLAVREQSVSKALELVLERLKEN